MTSNDQLELRPDGPHSDDYTVRVAWGLAEAVRILNYATGSHPGVTYPSTAYDVIGALKTAAQRLPQLCDQLMQFLIREFEAGRITDVRTGRPAESVAAAELALAEVRVKAHAIAHVLERAHNAANGLAAAKTGEGR